MQKIIWDNLHAHKTPYVTHNIEGRVSHIHLSLVDRPPYCTKIVPIEYIFYELAAEQEMHTRMNDEW